jgi:hypothetical protein
MDKLQLQQHAEFKVNPIEVSTGIKLECFRISSDFFMGEYGDKDTSTYYFRGKNDKYIIDLQYNTVDRITFKWNLQYKKSNGSKSFRENFKTELEVAQFINTKLK